MALPQRRKGRVVKGVGAWGEFVGPQHRHVGRADGWPLTLATGATLGVGHHWVGDSKFGKCSNYPELLHNNTQGRQAGKVRHAGRPR